MDEPPKENPPADFNKIDLSQLQGFSFGTQWTQDKNAGGGDKRERGEGRPRRDGDAGPDRRDRRGFRRPDGPGGEGGGGENREGAGAGGPGGDRPPRREFSGDRRPRPEGRDFRGGPRGGPGERQGHGHFQGGRPEVRAPYDSPFFSVTFYPEDTSFNALVKTVRASCRTIELFEIARTVLGKPERFTVLLTRRDPNAPRQGVPARQPQAGPAAAPAGESAGGPAEGAGPDAGGREKEAIYLAVPDSLPFESEEAAVAHVLSRHLAQFLDSAEVDVDPPKGNFQVINRCGVTGELLGPPNYHRYNQIVQQHYAAKAIRMPFEGYKSRIESVRDPEVVNQWLEKMKKVTRYTSKLPVAEGQTAPAFDTWEDARTFLLAQGKDKLVRPSGHARFHGRAVETLPPGEIRRAVEGTLERQRRFPLDTANALRGRLRREHFTIFKKGAKGISYVCAVKRKFRAPGQTFAETIGALINFVEAHPMVKAGELPRKFLGLAPEGPAAGAATAAAPGAGAGAAAGAGASAGASAGAGAGEGADAAPASANVLSVEQREKIARLQGDLLWLVREGYVTEFIDGSLYAPPPMVEARRKEVEREEHDPENFPERPAGAPAAAAPEGAEAADAGEAAPASEVPDVTEAPAASESAESSPAPTAPESSEGHGATESPQAASAESSAPAADVGEAPPTEHSSEAGSAEPSSSPANSHSPAQPEPAGNGTPPANHRSALDAPSSAQSSELSQQSSAS